MPKVKIPYGSWSGGEETKELIFPDGFTVKVISPPDMPILSDEEIEERVFSGTNNFGSLLSTESKLLIIVDDITRPTPAYKVLRPLLLRIVELGVRKENVKILIGTGAHRPMTDHELRKKLGDEVVDNYVTEVHNFLTSKVTYHGKINGGRVYLNSLFSESDVRITIGSVMPHNETGFGGAAKLIIPGIADFRTIAFFHGSLKKRKVAQVSPNGYDHRSWIEDVTKKLGLDLSICCVTNAKSELIGLAVSDFINAHRQAAEYSKNFSDISITANELDNIDAILVNSYPLDSDPIQMGKSMLVLKKFPGKLHLAINAAEDGIFYHGMGMGMGVDIKRLLYNVPLLLIYPSRILCLIDACIQAFPSIKRISQSIYFYLNPLSYNAFLKKYDKYKDKKTSFNFNNGSPLVFSEKFPSWGFKRHFPNGVLFDNWDEFCKYVLKRSGGECRILLLPVAPLQNVNIVKQETFDEKQN